MVTSMAQDDMKCLIPECSHRAHSRGLCMMHYQRKRRGGTTERRKAVLGEATDYLFSIDDELLRKSRAAAVAAEIPLAEWIRRAMRAALSEG